MMLGISTCWWDKKKPGGDELINDILELGFKGVELEYRITNPVYQQMKPRLNKAVEVLSIHNYFPRPEERLKEKSSGDLLLLSSIDKDERSLAVKYSIRSIEHASDLEAGAVILHLGRVDMTNPIKYFRDMYDKGIVGKEEGKVFLDEQKKIRETKYSKYLDGVLFSLDKLNREAERKGVFLGIENRYHLHEIPSFDEIGLILREFEGGNVRYWHDVGHAAAQENVGICTQKDLLEAYSDDMIGIHLHDIKGLDDHIPPGQGEIDYRELIPFLRHSMIKILEINHRVEKQNLLEGVSFIEKGIRELTKDG